MDFSWAAGMFGIFLLVLGLLGLLFWIWMLIDCALNETTENQQKLIWILVIIFVNLLGAIIYFFVRKLPRRH
jgi:hypothetical protein